jgi:hypothetical protein
VESNIEVHNATLEDGEYIASNMREADRREIWASNRHTPQEAIAICLQQKVCLCAHIDGIPAILFGCSPGVPWLLSTDDIKKIGVVFIMRSRGYVSEWLKEFGVLENYVHSENTLSIRWLKWLGFSILEPVTVNNETFYRFEMRDANV